MLSASSLGTPIFPNLWETCRITCFCLIRSLQVIKYEKKKLLDLDSNQEPSG